jgi:CRISPR-associated protein Csd1
VILQALCDYYEILAQAGEISKPGYGVTGVSLALQINEAGELTRVFSLKTPQQRGKKTVEVERKFELPLLEKRTSGIAANFLWDNARYVLGYDAKDNTSRAQDCFMAFKALHHKLLDHVDCREAKALLAFLDDWQPAQAAKSALLADYLPMLASGANLVFCLHSSCFLHQCPAILAAWDTHCSRTSEHAATMQCLVTGERAPASVLHASLKGVRGGQATGTSLVSFNDASSESYGKNKGQGRNAPVSKRAAFAYTTALNYLLAGNKSRLYMGDTTMVFWAHSPEKCYENLFFAAVNPEKAAEKDAQTDDDGTQRELNAILCHVMNGEAVAMPRFDPETRFYILGLAPNAARAAVRFFYADSFGNILRNLKRHYDDLEIQRPPNEHYDLLPLWVLMNETVSPNSRDKVSSPLLTGAALRAIISGTAYPEALFSAVMVRIRAEGSITRAKVAIIKACLLRKKNFEHKEDCTVALNDQSTTPAYVLGRLFAVLEKAQKDALGGIKSTIKDRYFSSACAAPASVFPVLLRLSQHHIAKADYGWKSSQNIQKLMEKLDESNAFPTHLGLNEQGIFILGYYHQQNENYAKSKQGEE